MSESSSSKSPARGLSRQRREQAQSDTTSGFESEPQAFRAHAVTIEHAESSDTTVNQTNQSGTSSPAPEVQASHLHSAASTRTDPADHANHLQSPASSGNDPAAPQRPAPQRPSPRRAGRRTGNSRPPRPIGNPRPPRPTARRGGSTRSLRMNATSHREADEF